MASVQIYRIQFITSNPFSGFVSGDTLDIFIETTSAVVPAAPLAFVTTGITVNLNGVSYPSGGSSSFLLLTENIDYLVSAYNPQICIGTSLLSFAVMSFLWPYAYYYSQENHFSCVINPPTCDLMINGVPIVIPATDAVTADGSIQIIASSTLNIEFNLGSDFVYGEGSVESYFGGLLPGSYRIYLRDEANCAVNILVQVTFDNTFGPKHRLEYSDYKALPTRVDVTMRGYSGSIFEACGTDTPFEIQLRGEGSQDKFEALMSSQGNLNLTSETDLQFLELYTNDPNLYRLEYSKDFGRFTESEGGFTPASLPALSAWTNIDNGGLPWTISAAPLVDFNLAGLGNISDILHTAYSFVAGRTYTFDYTFVAPAVIATYRVKIYDVSMNELLNTDIVLGSTTQSGQYIVTAPVGAAGIGIIVDSPASCGAGTPGFCEKRITQFDNVTVTIPATPPVAIGYEILWHGKILPQQYSEDYKAPPYYVSVIATDGLAELKQFYLIQGDGQKYFGTISLIKLVAYCLSFTKLGLDIRVACNLYADTMNQEDGNDPFDQAYVDFEAFYLAEKEPTLDFVLKSILDPFGARITQWEERWNIVRVEEMLSSYDYRQFDAEGNYLSNGTFNPVIEIQYPDDADETTDVVLAQRDHNLEMKPGYGKLKAIYSLGLKPNILNNGDFRLKSVYIPSLNLYSFTLNKDGWTLVNDGYAISEAYEFIDENNIAYTITSGDDTTGQAYLQSETYFVKMGTNNQLKLTVRLKVVRQSVIFAGTVYTIDVPYVKIRIKVQYGSLYLQADGTWTSTDNTLTFYCTEFNKFADYEILASQPVSGSPVGGMDLNVRVYQPYPYLVDFTTLADLEALVTWTGTEHAIPTGYRTELRETTTFAPMYYYELEENTDTPAGFSIVRPDDYNVSNERQWILKTQKGTQNVLGTGIHKTAIDRIQLEYLTDGKSPIDTIVRAVPAEGSNQLILEKELILGSYSNLIVTEVSLGIALGVFFPSGGLALTTTNTLSADLIYTGYLRSSEGVGYEFFARDGVAESDKLHGILLKQYALQYRKSWRLLRGSVYAHRYFGLLNVGKLINDSNRIYLPIGLTLDDKKQIWSGEFLELKGSGGDGDTGTNPYSSGFTIGFGASGYN